MGIINTSKESKASLDESLSELIEVVDIIKIAKQRHHQCQMEFYVKFTRIVKVDTTPLKTDKSCLEEKTMNR